MSMMERVLEDSWDEAPPRDRWLCRMRVQRHVTNDGETSHWQDARAPTVGDAVALLGRHHLSVVHVSIQHGLRQVRDMPAAAQRGAEEVLRQAGHHEVADLLLEIAREDRKLARL